MLGEIGLCLGKQDCVGDIGLCCGKQNCIGESRTVGETTIALGN